MHKLLNEVVDDFAPTANLKHQTLNANFDNQPIWMHGDSVRIAQVLSNLLGNASKYSPEHSTIALGAGVRSGTLTITVSDNGIGISEQDQANLFAPFFRAADQQTQAQAGTGLGLVIVKSIVELHGGQIAIDSEKDVGTTVRISLPDCTTEQQSRI